MDSKFLIFLIHLKFKEIYFFDYYSNINRNYRNSCFEKTRYNTPITRSFMVGLKNECVRDRKNSR